MTPERIENIRELFVSHWHKAVIDELLDEIERLQLEVTDLESELLIVRAEAFHHWLLTTPRCERGLADHKPWTPPPVYPYDQWVHDDANGWVNPEDDPATGTEEALLDEIERLQAEAMVITGSPVTAEEGRAILERLRKRVTP